MESEIKYPIRILHILHSMNRGGAENALMNYYRQIDKAKVQFDFLLTDQNKCDFEEEILALGGKIFRVPLLTMLHPWNYINGVKRFLKSHREYLIVHSHTSSKSIIPLAIAKYCKIPIRIAHSHNSKSESGFRGIIRNTFKPFLKITANIYCSCGLQASDWLYGKKMTLKGKVIIVRNVIDASKFKYDLEKRKRIRKDLGIGENTFVLGHIARFCKEKNHLFSLEIIKTILQKNPDSILLLVGDGPQRAEITSYSESLGVAEKVKMLGVVPNVYDYEQAMDAFILPSFYEGLPLSIIEAQVSGLPCFTTKDKVSDECSVTNLVKYMPLEDGAEVWAEAILDSASMNRMDRYEEIKAAGYDSETAAMSLQNLYLTLANSTLKQ